MTAIHSKHSQFSTPVVAAMKLILFNVNDLAIKYKSEPHLRTKWHFPGKLLNLQCTQMFIQQLQLANFNHLFLATVNVPYGLNSKKDCYSMCGVTFHWVVIFLWSLCYFLWLPLQVSSLFLPPLQCHQNHSRFSLFPFETV